MSDERKKTGSIGEKLASEYLERIGYTILQRNFRCRYGEIDIIACNREYLVFCEVKTRKGSAPPLHLSLSVTKAKGKRIRELASLYLMEHEDETRQPSFDEISVILNENHERMIEHLENAF